MELSRRKLFSGIGLLIAAPAIVPMAPVEDDPAVYIPRQIFFSPSKTVTVTWSACEGAVSYNVYGGDPT